MGWPNELEASNADVYQVFSLCYARAPQRRIHENFIRPDMHDGPMPLDFNLWILKNSLRTILVDTGFGERAAVARGRPLDIDPVDAVRRLGIEPDTITDIILTHLHYDHAGNIDRFPNARFHVQDAEVEYATGRCMCHRALRYPYDAEDVVSLIRKAFSGRVAYHRGTASPFPGVSLHHLPGHSRGVQGVRVATPRGPILLASDASHYYANFLLGAPFVVTVDLEQSLQSYADMLGLVDGIERIVPGHDPRVRDLYPHYEINGVSLCALHEQPKPHIRESLAQW